MVSGKIRVVVVDDSALMRRMISDSVSQAPDMEVVATASDGAIAVEMCRRHSPDVVTLDIRMPRMDGLATLDALLQQRPVPVIMVSALTQAGADVTLDALERGALDYVAKPDRAAGSEHALANDLVRKIRSAAGADVQRLLRVRRDRKQRQAQQTPSRAVADTVAETGAVRLGDKCIAIGISTGGPPALASLFETLRPPMPPIVVVQHMPATFTGSLSRRLNDISRLAIKEAASGDILRPNHVLIANGASHLELRRKGKFVMALLRDGEPVSGHKPSADVLMKSVAEIYGRNCMGIIMTGMGRDGSNGCGCIRQKGGFVLGQDEATSDVYGMNKVAFVEGNVDRQFSLDEAAAVITRQVAQLWCKSLPRVAV
ncbi:MAG: protein-glutamate methylesterase/protein-glutamine glutaminase [Thermoguttaceae bacterium]